MLLDRRQSTQTMVVVLISVLILGVLYALGSLSLKILGGMFVALGLLFYFVLPGQYQKGHHTKLGQDMGLLLLGLGILLLLVG